MQHLLETAENTMEELDSMKTRGYSTSSSHDRCDLCVESLRGQQYYLFPCSHGFHSSCLLNEAHKFLSGKSLSDLIFLQESLGSLTMRAKDADSRTRSQLEALQQELDGYIAADCPLCGYMMISSVAASLIREEEQEIANSWKF